MSSRPVDTSSSLSIIIFGASGDLASRKIFRAIFQLYCKGALPSHITIIGYARSQLTRAEFEARVIKNIVCSDSNKVKEFLRLCHYVKGNYDVKEDIENLHLILLQHEKTSNHLPQNRIFHFAVSPSTFIPLAQRLRESCMAPDPGWTRVIVEKPFGKDLSSCNKLMDALSIFGDERLFKTDHYLGKSMVQNLLVLRFANSIFESLWDKQHISNVLITLTEDIGVEGRGSYFDEYGIIRDVMQNHMMQMLSLIGMEPPQAIEAAHIQAQKIDFLKHIAPINLSNLALGQFGPSKSGWFEKGYLELPDVRKDSRTPTYATAVIFVDNERWDNVPFILRCGKGLDERKVEICIQFKPQHSTIFKEQEEMPNELVIRVQPDESISVKLVTKHPGLSPTEDFVESEIDLSYKNRFGTTIIPDAYERLLLDVLEGDHSSFLQTEELQETWRIFTPALQQLETQDIKPEIYPFGSSGPENAVKLVQNYGFKRSGKASR